MHLILLEFLVLTSMLFLNCKGDISQVNRDRKEKNIISDQALEVGSHLNKDNVTARFPRVQ